eukprot:SAG31_NODE_14683_length_793_cov_0.899135_1_plen_194_part_01
MQPRTSLQFRLERGSRLRSAGQLPQLGSLQLAQLSSCTAAGGMSGLRLEGKTVLITGGGTGIGRGIAERFAKEGAQVALGGRRREILEETCDAIVAKHGAAGSHGELTAVPVIGDVSDPVQAERMVAETIEKLGGISVLVNNAGNVDRTTVEGATLAGWDAIFDLNTRAVFVTCQAAIVHMKLHGGGVICNISS